MRPAITAILSSLVLSACADTTATLEPQTNDSITTEITNGLHHPWSLAFVSDNEWLITERRGTLRRVVDGELQDTNVDGVPDVVASGQAVSYTHLRAHET